MMTARRFARCGVMHAIARHARPDAPARACLGLSQALVLVGLDTSDPAHPDGRVGADELAWLDGELADARDRRAACTRRDAPSPVFQPIGYAGLRGFGPLAGVLYERGCAGVLCGHTHHATHGMAHGVPYWTAPSLSFAADASQRKDAPWLFGPQALTAEKVVHFYESWGYSVHEVASDGTVASHAVTHATNRLLGDLMP